MNTGNAIQLADGRALTTERVELIKRTSCPKGISDDDFALFIETCRRSGLDPLLKQAFCVPRRNNIGSREKPNWVEKHECQPSEAGMLARAEEFPDYLGTQASEVYAEDEILMDQGAGEVSHKFNPAKRKGALTGAWAKVSRIGKVPSLVWLDLSALRQNTSNWNNMPAIMIAKCARVAALRKAYPAAYGGLYIAEELPESAGGEPEVRAARPIMAVAAVPALPPAPQPQLTRGTEDAVVPGEPPADVQLPSGPPAPLTEAYDRHFEAEILGATALKELQALARSSKGKVLNRERLNVVFLKKQGELNRSGTGR